MASTNPNSSTPILHPVLPYTLSGRQAALEDLVERCMKATFIEVYKPTHQPLPWETLFLGVFFLTVCNNTMLISALCLYCRDHFGAKTGPTLVSALLKGVVHKI